MSLSPEQLSINPLSSSDKADLAAQLDFVRAAADELGLLPDDPAEAEHSAAWRLDVVEALNHAQRYSDAAAFADCGKYFGNFSVAVCVDDSTHEARAIPFTCHKRFCPDCERRAQAKQVRRLCRIIDRAVERHSKPNDSLKKFELTTNFSLFEENAPELFDRAWGYLERFLHLLGMHLFADELSTSELKHQKVNFTAHGCGIVVQVEFGEQGRKLHFHVLALLPFVPKQVITNLWLEATEGQFSINWIRRIDRVDLEDAIREQVKYITKFTNLPPELVPALADVLDGSRRMRTYGVFRVDKDDPVEVDEPHACKDCGNAIEIVTVRDYFERVIACGAEPSREIAALAPSIFLDLKLGNKSGAVSPDHMPRSDPDSLFDASLPGFAAVFDRNKWRED